MSVVDTAVAEWELHVPEPPAPGSERIDAYIRGLDGLGWTWLHRYKRNGSFAWCGAFAAYCYGIAGLDAEIRAKHLASTYRLWDWSKRNARRIAPRDIRVGDIVVVGNGGHRWGDHIAIAEICGESIQTIEGNAHGTLGDGTHGEGVIRTVRRFESSDPKALVVRYGVRPLPEDY